MLGFSRPQLIAFLVMLALILVLPFVLYPVFLMRVLCAALFACAFNLMIGYVGLLSFGHAAYFGMGSYVAAWTMKVWHVDASIAIALGGLTGGVLGLCLGYLAIRRSGIYFAMITLALAQMVYFFCLEAPFTGGEDGIQQVPRGFLFGFHVESASNGSVQSHRGSELAVLVATSLDLLPSSASVHEHSSDTRRNGRARRRSRSEHH